MRKINRIHENFIDNHLLDFVEYTMPFYRKLNMTQTALMDIMLENII